MKTLYRITDTHSEEQYSFLVLIDHSTGRTYTTDTGSLHTARSNDYNKYYNCEEIFTTGSTKTAAVLVLDRRMDRVPTLISTYSRDQHYGGPEEGGWYYHNLVFISSRKEIGKCFKLVNETDQYGEGTLEYIEAIPGVNQNLNRPHYC